MKSACREAVPAPKQRTIATVTMITSADAVADGRLPIGLAGGGEIVLPTSQ